MQSALDISTHVIYQHWKNGIPITNLKLQKILYYVQGYVSKFCNEPAFPEPIYNWPYGPVVPEAYYAYNENRAMPIPEPDSQDIMQAESRLGRDKATQSVMDQVINVTYRYTSSMLVGMTHNEDPWKDTSESQEITYPQIARYFRSHDPLNLGAQR